MIFSIFNVIHGSNHTQRLKIRLELPSPQVSMDNFPLTHVSKEQMHPRQMTLMAMSVSPPTSPNKTDSRSNTPRHNDGTKRVLWSMSNRSTQITNVNLNPLDVKSRFLTNHDSLMNPLNIKSNSLMEHGFLMSPDKFDDSFVWIYPVAFLIIIILFVASIIMLVVVLSLE